MNRLCEMYHKKRELETEEAKIKAELLGQMQQCQIEKLENDKIKVNYIDKSFRKRIDSQKLKEVFPDVYSACVKDSEVQPYIRVQVLK